ncbi:hypothetical protein GQ607_005120 [Colletotrichum asianum]|uniref:Uncharacterized protein n=1 Tax=Colletotrichum asianum TaxID=702518 RepID=A0A8H3WKQ5_9PEZI|nr:hypothetical protein GQ607_005120 [Colletotrichum asianum]
MKTQTRRDGPQEMKETTKSSAASIQGQAGSPEFYNDVWAHHLEMLLAEQPTPPSALNQLTPPTIHSAFHPLATHWPADWY